MPTPVNVKFVPRFGSVDAVSSVSINGKDDKEIVELLKGESPSHLTHTGGLSFREAHSLSQLEDAYTPIIGDPQGIYHMFAGLNKSPRDAAQDSFNAISRRYIILDSKDRSYRGLGYVNLRVHPIVAQVAQLYHGDLGRAGYRYEDKPEAKKAFPVLFQVMDMPDKARAGKLLKEAFGYYQGIDGFSKIVDKFVSDVLPNRK